MATSFVSQPASHACPAAPHRLVLITEIISPYRIPVFNELAKKKEVDLHVIFLAENDPGLRQWRVYKKEIEFSYEVLPSWRQRIGKFNLLLNLSLSSALSRISPEVLLCGGYNYPASWQAAYWARSRRIPFLLWTESTALDSRRRHFFIEFLKSRFLDLCRGFVVPGISSADYLRALGVSDDRIFAAPNAVDNQRFSRLAAQSRLNRFALREELSLPVRYFLFVGRLVRAKGVFEILEAYSMLDPVIRNEVGLVFAGDGADKGELIRRSARFRSAPISFPGFVQRDALPSYYAFADALLFPTHSDPWGLVVNEAMSCGLPVIASRVAGCTPDLVQDGSNGFVIDPRNSSQLAAAMSRLALDSSLRAQMSERSSKRIAAYTAGTWAEGIVNCLDAVNANG